MIWLCHFDSFSAASSVPTYNTDFHNLLVSWAFYNYSLNVYCQPLNCYFGTQVPETDLMQLKFLFALYTFVLYYWNLH